MTAIAVFVGLEKGARKYLAHKKQWLTPSRKVLWLARLSLLVILQFGHHSPIKTWFSFHKLGDVCGLSETAVALTLPQTQKPKQYHYWHSTHTLAHLRGLPPSQKDNLL